MLGARSSAQIACSITAVYFASWLSMGVGREISRPPVSGRVTSFSSREVTRFGAPSLITRNTNDVQQVQMLVQMSLDADGDGADHDGSAA